MALPLIRLAYADHPLGQIHYRYALPTTRKPLTPIVFLHQSASSSKCWEKMINYYVSLGHPCYASDMPGFGGSFDPDPAPNPPYTTTFYVDVYIHLFKSLGLFDGKFHVIGHHTGSTMALEMAVEYAHVMKSITLIGAGLMNAAERAELKSKYFNAFNEPVRDGSHLLKTWNYMAQGAGLLDHLDIMQIETIDHIRAWRGRNQVYGAVWESDRQANFLAVTCPILALCARDDVLWQYFHYVNELRPEVKAVEVDGGSFEHVLGWESCVKLIDEMIIPLE